jgi:hypothetical protein
MTDASGFPKLLDEALSKFFAEVGEGDVNGYLDRLGIEHPQLSVYPGRPSEFHIEMPLCGDGYHWEQSTYYNKHSGWTTVGGCVWNAGMH